MILQRDRRLGLAVPMATLLIALSGCNTRGIVELRNDTDVAVRIFVEIPDRPLDVRSEHGEPLVGAVGAHDTGSVMLSGSTCEAWDLVARTAEGDVVARREGPQCPDDVWLLEEPASG